MDYLFVFLAGLGAAAGSVLGPGMLNMNVVKTTLNHNRRAGFQFAAGILSIYLIQSSIGVIGANYLGITPELIKILEQLAIPAFMLLAIIFFYRGYKKHFAEKEVVSPGKDDRWGHYLAGFSLGLMNLLAIPYYYALSIWLFDGDNLPGNLRAKILFVLSAAVGVWLIFTVYTLSAKKINRHARPITVRLNFVVAGVLCVLAAVQTYKMYLS